MKEQKNSKAKARRIIAALMAMALICAGCSNGKEKETISQSEVTYPEEGTYPVKCDDELTLWISLNTSLSTRYSNFGETPLAAELEKATGIKVNYIHPSVGSESEQFNLLLVSDSMPDIIASNWTGYGGQKAIKEKYILPLNEIWDKWAPNVKKVVSEIPEVDMAMRTDDGNYYCFPFIRGDEALCVFGGPIVRADWLKKLNMDVPETIDDWEEMLIAFKEKMGAKAPLSLLPGTGFTTGMFTGAYGVIDGFYVDNGKVKYGPYEKGYKDFIFKMREWYDKGLIDNNLAGIDTKILESNILSGKTGATWNLLSGGLGSWLAAKQNAGDTEFDLVGAPNPVLKEGQKPKFGQKESLFNTSICWAISRDCKNVELAARYLDFGYSDEGYMLLNYGPEGKTYEMKDGTPVFTDYVTNNPDGKAMGSVLSDYIMGSYSGPMVQSLHLKQQLNTYPQQSAAMDTWSNTDAAEHIMPMITLTEEEKEEYSLIGADLFTYKTEMFYGFIMGTHDLSEYDDYMKTLKKLKVERMIEIQQQAYDRYMSKK